MMTEEKKRQIVKTLFQRVSNIACPICHQSKYSFVDGYTIDPVQNDYKDVQLGGKVIPSVMLVCNNCGHIDRFSLGVLGLMDKEDQTQQK